MKSINLPLCLIFMFLFVSCGEDIDDPVDPFSGEYEEEEEQPPFTFLDDEGNLYYTGLLDSFCYGFNGPPLGSEGALNDYEIPEELPDSYDLSEFLPPVRSQGQQGSCSAWATSYYMKYLQENLEHGADSIVPVLSPAYTYNLITMGECQGTAVSAHLQLLKSRGVCTWSSFPYTDMHCLEQPGAAQDEEAEFSKITDFKQLSGENMVNEMKALLVDQIPIVLSVGLDPQFGKRDALGLTAYREHPMTSDDITGAHAMLAVGYDDANDAFKLVNSWGTGWGDSGFVWIDYEAFDNVLNDDYSFKVICSAYVSFDEIEEEED